MLALPRIRSVALLAALALFAVGCKQQNGEVCDVDSDCASEFCCGARLPEMRGICQAQGTPCEVGGPITPTTDASAGGDDAGTDAGGDEDGGLDGGSSADGGADAGTPHDAGAEEDAGAIDDAGSSGDAGTGDDAGMLDDAGADGGDNADS